MLDVATSFNAMQRPRAQLRDYIRIARLDHCTKHIFILPGAILATLLRGVRNVDVAHHIICGLIVAACIASANYVINEWLDRDSDRHHPTKSQRTAVQRDLRGELVLLEWGILVSIGLLAARASSTTMLVLGMLFALQGVVYNVPPLRTKNIAYFDVISESINNPFRLLIGWAMIDATSLPPSSLILAYWLGGAFLMGAKRLSEYRDITSAQGKDRLILYRASFTGYSEASLTVCCFLYALLSTFFLAVFLVKYRIEYLFVMPNIIFLFGQYLSISLQTDSSAQRPEKLYTETGLLYQSIIIGLIFIISSIINTPWLEHLTSQTFISIS